MAKLYNDTVLPDSDLKFTDCQYTGQFLETETGLNAIYYHDGKLYYFGKFTRIPHQIEHEGILKMHEDTLLLMKHRPDLYVSERDMMVHSDNIFYVLSRQGKYTEYLAGYGWVTFLSVVTYNVEYWIFNDINGAIDYITPNAILAPCCKL